VQNLSSWKNRRKSQSSQQYQLREELEQMEKEKEEPTESSMLTTKTFSQMKEERYIPFFFSLNFLCATLD
jgi:hypothetical protein